MRTLSMIILPVLMLGCAKSPQSTLLTEVQAKAVAMRLANDESSKLYSCQPFREDRPARLEAGRWVWKARGGVGLSDVEARVELAVDGSTNCVDLILLNSQNRLLFRPREHF